MVIQSKEVGVMATAGGSGVHRIAVTYAEEVAGEHQTEHET